MNIIAQSFMFNRRWLKIGKIVQIYMNKVTRKQLYFNEDVMGNENKDNMCYKM